MPTPHEPPAPQVTSPDRSVIRCVGPGRRGQCGGRCGHGRCVRPGRRGRRLRREPSRRFSSRRRWRARRFRDAGSSTTPAPAAARQVEGARLDTRRQRRGRPPPRALRDPRAVVLRRSRARGRRGHRRLCLPLGVDARGRRHEPGRRPCRRHPPDGATAVGSRRGRRRRPRRRGSRPPHPGARRLGHRVRPLPPVRHRGRRHRRVVQPRRRPALPVARLGSGPVRVDAGGPGRRPQRGRHPRARHAG